MVDLVRLRESEEDALSLLEGYCDLGLVDKLIGPEAGSGDMYEAEIACLGFVVARGETA